MNADERETVIVLNDGNDEVRIWTCRRPDITAMDRKEAFTCSERGRYDDGTEWATYTIPRSRFSIARAARGQRVLTDEQRAEMAEVARRRFGHQSPEGVGV